MAAPFTSQLLSFFFLLLSQLAPHSAKEDAYDPKTCHPFHCGVVPIIQFPFANASNPKCGVYIIECENGRIPKIKFEEHGRSFVVKSISYEPTQLTIQDDDLLRLPKSQVCNSLHKFTLPVSPFLNFTSVTPNLTFLDCKRDLHNLLPENYHLNNYTDCQGHVIYYSNESLPVIKHNCSVIQFPASDWLVDPYGSKRDLSTLLAAGFGLKWNLTHECSDCHEKRKGFCNRNETTGQFICSGAKSLKRHRKPIIIGVCAGFGVLLACLVTFIFLRYRNIRYVSTSSKLLSRAISSDPSLKSDLEKSNNFPTQFFNYKELEEATNNFDTSKELGDGGFGTVYHGTLRDGRNVAVKRLYENNYRRVEQFKNEIKILSHLRHQNLVTLYGCSSRHSRELLLVYEYIPNGTVADHLHGDRAKPGALTWPIRMSIAIETADALKYLHCVEIIHRDVKTSNILLDNNFSVKVADFGLSRFFPTGVTHISTAPQGTPGYIDPDYHQCYQLTDKSDVYSFGVVLIELISSKPAVDITRHRCEINLANLAIKKIHDGMLNELVDPTLGFDSDCGVRRMITMVAELAFRCLQDEKDIRPSMEEVLDMLRGIESEEYKGEILEVVTAADEEVLLKKMPPLSPNTVTNDWESRTTTPNSSG